MDNIKKNKRTPDIHVSVTISYLAVFRQNCMHLSSPASPMYAPPAPPRPLNQPNGNRCIQYTVKHNTFDLTTFDEEQKK